MNGNSFAEIMDSGCYYLLLEEINFNLKTEIKTKKESKSKVELVNCHNIQSEKWFPKLQDDSKKILIEMEKLKNHYLEYEGNQDTGNYEDYSPLIISFFKVYEKEINFVYMQYHSELKVSADKYLADNRDKFDNKNYKRNLKRLLDSIDTEKTLVYPLSDFVLIMENLIYNKVNESTKGYSIFNNEKNHMIREEYFLVDSMVRLKRSMRNIAVHEGTITREKFQQNYFILVDFLYFLVQLKKN